MDRLERLHEGHPVGPGALLRLAVPIVGLQNLHGLVAGGDGVVKVELLLHEGLVLLRALVLRLLDLLLGHVDLTVQAGDLRSFEDVVRAVSGVLRPM